jgi:anthraniloyl-CoA monooxygenase
VDYDRLRLGDGDFVDRVDRRFAGGDGQSFRLAAAPMHAPLELRGLRLANRVAVRARPVPVPSLAARDGLLGDRGSLARWAAVGAGLVCTPTIAVAAEGRITPEDAGLYRDDHTDAWRAAIEPVEAAVLMRIGHAGPRGACRPRREGLDRPLRDPWPLVAATATPYARGGTVPEALDEAGMTRVCEQFAAAARRADAAGVDVLQLQLAHGGLLASFLSPLTNDGTLEQRMTFPLTVVEAVRAAWPDDKPLAVALPAADWAPRGWTLDEAVVLVRALVQRGVDLVEPLSGQGSPAACPPYGRGFLVPASDRLRNEAGCATLVDGHLTRTSEINTILAAGRADLCVFDLEAERLSASADAAPTPGALLEVPA